MTTLTPIELIAVAFFTVVVIFNMLIGLSIIFHGRHHQKQALIALKGIGDTHMLGFEALTTDLDRLRTRVEALELRTGLGSRVDRSIHNS